MKRIFRIIAAVVCLFFCAGMTSCFPERKLETGQKNPKTLPYKEIGEMLTLHATAASEQYPADNASNGVGMSGEASVINTHMGSRDMKDTMWLTEENPLDPSITFALEKPEPLGKFFIWNYNEIGNTGCGLKDVDVQYSLDGETYQSIGQYTLKRGSGEERLKTTNHLGGDPVDFQGAVAQYIKIVPNPTNGNYGGKAYGLSEVRLYRYKPEAVSGAYMPAKMFSKEKEKLSDEAHRLVSGVGLSSIKDPNAVHSNRSEDMYRMEDAEALIFDLGGTYPVGEIEFFNYNDPKALDCGLKNITVFFGVEMDVMQTREHFILEKATGSDAQKGQKLKLSEVREARYIKIQPKQKEGNYGGNGYGLSSVRFILGDGWYVEAADEWSGLIGNYDGWTGADGIYSGTMTGDERPLYDKRADDFKVFFTFGDTVTTKYNPITKLRTNLTFTNNTFLVVEGNDPFTAKTTFTIKEGKVPVFPPYSDKGIYWISDNYYFDGKINIPAANIIQGDGKFGQESADLLTIGTKNGTLDFHDVEIKTERENKYLYHVNDRTTTVFGGAMLMNTKEAGVDKGDGYYYMYGFMDIGSAMNRNMVVLRFKPEDGKNFEKWEYYGKEGWSKNIEDCTSLLKGIAAGYSVTYITSGENKGKYMVTYSRGAIFPQIECRLADSPTGPWSAPKTLYESSIPLETDYNMSCYEAKVHPVISTESEYLISYNIISKAGDFKTLLEQKEFHTPHFLRCSRTDLKK